MDDIIAQSQALKAFWVSFFCAAPFVLMLVALLGLRGLDKLAGVKFREQAVVVSAEGWLGYAGRRWLGVCIVVAASLIGLGLVLAS